MSDKHSMICLHMQTPCLRMQTYIVFGGQASGRPAVAVLAPLAVGLKVRDVLQLTSPIKVNRTPSELSMTPIGGHWFAFGLHFLSVLFLRQANLISRKTS